MHTKQMLLHNLPCVILLLLQLLLLLNTKSSTALPIQMRDSRIQTIIVPYYSSTAAGKPYQYPAETKMETRQVLVPKQVEMAPRFELIQGAMAMGSHKGAAVNFAEGAYPVYYMPGNANGRFNGQISLLDGVPI